MQIDNVHMDRFHDSKLLHGVCPGQSHVPSSKV